MEINHMTDEQMLSRMREIDACRNQLLQERREYELYFKEKKEEQDYIKHKGCEGKCYEVSGIINYPTVKYLQILNIKEDNIKSARCLCLLEDTRSRCAIHIMDLSLWIYNDNQLIHKGNEPLVIDVCKEIPGKEFIQVFDKYVKRLTDELYGEYIDDEEFSVS